MINVENKYIPFGRFKRIAIWPFVFVKKGSAMTKININHEKIHLRQQLEMMIFGVFIGLILTITLGFNYWYILMIFSLFFAVYLINWIWELIKILFEDKKAYRDLWFEKEAYFNQDDIEYLKKRNHFAWLKYI